MRAWLLHDFSGLDALELRDDVVLPQPAGGEVLLRLRFAALNPADRFLAERLYPAKPKFPHILGRDGSGVVEQVGPGVQGVKVGDRVAVLRGDAGVDRQGTFAEYVAVPQEVVVPIADGWSEPQAAAAPLVYLTAYQALTQWGPLNEATVLITGVSGGVGVASLQLAKAMGFRVIGLTRGTDKFEKLREFGADLLLDAGDAELKVKTKEFTSRRGVDLIIDCVAGPLFNVLIETLSHGGRISVVGALGGLVPDFNPAKLLFRRGRIGGVLVSDFKGEPARTAWNEIISLLNSIGARPVIDSVFPMGRLKEAFSRLAEGPIGKVVLEVTR